eukprot:TRINITY_DN60515_c0_g1_i2.p1 TRINITY_DN60515_c0_g1~~TRINITY_DN60515_c0_g1_i2.p1  ORF type:complete len:286 (+),score=36.93 TRINITY_DN60515_c0_g1_i2:46-903(+)
MGKCGCCGASGSTKRGCSCSGGNSHQCLRESAANSAVATSGAVTNTAPGGSAIAEGARVSVLHGKYEGQQGTVLSHTDITCKLKMDDGTQTGNLKLKSIRIGLRLPSPAESDNSEESEDSTPSGIVYPPSTPGHATLNLQPSSLTKQPPTRNDPFVAWVNAQDQSGWRCPEPPLLTVSYRSEDSYERRKMRDAAAAGEQEDAEKADPYGICDYIRDKNFWPTHRVFIDQEAFGECDSHWQSIFHWAQWHSLSLIHISEPTRLLSISYAVFCLKKKKKINIKNKNC